MLDVGCTQILLQLALQDIGQLTDIEHDWLNPFGPGPCRTASVTLRNRVGTESGLSGQLGPRQAATRGESGLPSLWHRPYQAVERGCHIHVA
jgi:hypothetical protein